MYKLIVFCFAFAFYFKANSLVVIPKDSIKTDSIIQYSKSFLGTPYKYATSNPAKGFDCSGFVSYVFNHFNVKVPRSSIDYAHIGTEISMDSCRIGDVIVFTGTNSKNRHPGHVGIIISSPGEELLFIHSSSNKKNGGVKLSTFKESPYYKVRFLKIVRIVNCY